MVKHIVMWSLKDFAEGRSRSENLQEMKIRLLGLKSAIREIQSLEVGINFNESEDGYDIVLYSEFGNRKDLDAYQKHPEHVKARDFIRRVRLEKRVVDFEM